MNRRSALKYFVLISAGTVLLPTCKPGNKKSSSEYGHLPLDENDQDMLAEVAETIIPATDTPGAKETSAHVYTLMMLNDCYEQNDRDKFLSGMKEFSKNCKQKYNKPFTDCDAKQKEEFIASANSMKEEKNDADYFFKTLKALTIKGYTDSKYYLSNVQVYKLVPGKYKPSVPVAV